MKKLVYLLLGICALIVGIGCSDDEDIRNWKDEPIKGIDTPEEETTDSYHITYQYKEGVIVLSPARQIFLDHVVADTILYFSSDTPEEILPAVGDVVTSSQSEKLPYGLGNVVLSRMEEGGFYKCVTTSTALDQIYSELEVSATFSMLDSLAGGFYDDEGNFIEAEWTETKAVDDIKSLTLNIKKELLNGHLNVEGYLTLGAKPNLEISLSQHQYEFSLEILNQCQMDVTGEISTDTEKVWPLFSVSKDLAPLPLGPLVLRPYVVIETSISVNGKITIGFAIKGNGHMKYGFRKNDQSSGFFREDIKEQESSTSIIHADGNICLSGQIKADVPKLAMGLGLYTKNIVGEIMPRLSFNYSADFDLMNLNAFRNQSALNAKVSAIVEARLFADLFFKTIYFPPISLSYDLKSWEFPFLPRLVDNSVKVEKGLSDPLTFYASYKLEDKGLLSFMFYPAIHIYEGSKEVMLQKKDGTAYAGDYVFPLVGLEKDHHYIAKPALCFRPIDICFDEDGVPFSAITPTASITDIVQTSASHGTDAFYYDGQYWDYEFKFYVNVHLVGSQYCKSWGIYDSNSIKKYNPCELKEGRQTQYWTAWGNSSSATFSKRPYVVLLDGNYIYYNESSHTLTYSELGDLKSLPLDISSGDLVFRLDSVATRP